MRSIEWYFDFISPFAYLQFHMLKQLPADLQVVFKPVLFAGLLKHWGHKGPAEIPEKRKFTYRFVQWQADRLGIPLKFPPAHPFNPIVALRLAVALDCEREAIGKIFDFIWREGDDVNNLHKLGEVLGFDDLDALTQDAAVKNLLVQNGAEAVAQGVFGVPTFVTGGELFWGSDSLDMLGEFLKNPAKFKTGEMERLGKLPVGVMRPDTAAK